MAEEAPDASASLTRETRRLSALVGEFSVARAVDDAALRQELRKVAPHAFSDSRGKDAAGVSRSQRSREPAEAKRDARRAVTKLKAASGGDDEWSELEGLADYGPVASWNRARIGATMHLIYPDRNRILERFPVTQLHIRSVGRNSRIPCASALRSMRRWRRPSRIWSAPAPCADRP